MSGANHQEQGPNGWDGPERRHTESSQGEFLGSPFWRVMAFVLTGLVAVTFWVAKSAVEKLDRVADGQIEMKTTLRISIEGQDKLEKRVGTLEGRVQSLEISSSLQQQRLDGERPNVRIPHMGGSQ